MRWALKDQPISRQKVQKIFAISEIIHILLGMPSNATLFMIFAEFQTLLMRLV